MPFPASPADLEKLGFRIVPSDTKSPKPGIQGYGPRDNPDTWFNFTTAARNFSPNDVPAILCGPCPALGGPGPENDHLICLDVDHDTTFADVERALGVALPPTLSSKGDKHRWYRVRPGALRDQIRQWPRFLGRPAPPAPEADIKWHGGYACEPNAWDQPVSVAAIAVLPDECVAAILDKCARALATAKPKKDKGLPPPRAEAVPMVGLPEAAVAALAEIWPRKQGRHDAAMALGAWLAQSDWALADALRFAEAVFARAGVSCRTEQVRYSWENKRLDPEAHAYGLPTIAAAAKANVPPVSQKEFSAAVRIAREAIPGLAPLASLDFAELLEVVYADNEERKAMALALTNGTHAEVARDILRRFLRRTIFAEGKLWRRRADGVWREIGEDTIARLTAKYDGLIYNVTTSGYQQKYEAVWKPVYDWICQFCSAPRFFERAPHGVPFADGFLILGRGAPRMVPLRRSRTRWVLPFAYAPDAARRKIPGAWLSFLASVWGEDRECIRLLHEILGYLLSGRQDAQKMFVLLGPTRAGKGVILRLLHELFTGRAAALEINQLADKFSLENLLGKTIAIDPDWRKPDPRAMGAIVARLLALSAGDALGIPRKHQTALAPMRLPIRLVMATNPPFGMVDAGAAMAGRMVILPLTRSFLGREDIGLFERLRLELPAIVDLALAAHRGWLDRGCRFTEPAAAAEAKETLAHIENPTLAFFEEECDFGEGAAYEVRADLLYSHFVAWREANGHSRMSSQTFTETLKAHGVKRQRGPRSTGRGRIYVGIRIRPADEPVKLGLVQGGPDPVQGGGPGAK